jgi:hypothetical protein
LGNSVVLAGTCGAVAEVEVPVEIFGNSGVDYVIAEAAVLAVLVRRDGGEVVDVDLPAFVGEVTDDVLVQLLKSPRQLLLAVLTTDDDVARRLAAIGLTSELVDSAVAVELAEARLDKQQRDASYEGPDGSSGRCSPPRAGQSRRLRQ